jgi:hypothetical protein
MTWSARLGMGDIGLHIPNDLWADQMPFIVVFQIFACTRQRAASNYSKQEKSTYSTARSPCGLPHIYFPAARQQPESEQAALAAGLPTGHSRRWS